MTQFSGVDVDDVQVSSGPGSTSFEDDGDTLDGWTVPGAPAGAPRTRTTGSAARSRRRRRRVGHVRERALARQPEMLDFLSDVFGPYPFSAAGSIVDDVRYSASRWRTRRARSTHPRSSRTLQAEDDEVVVVHELAHQWVGDALPLASWRNIWLNEGFATYTEWLWAEHHGAMTAQASSTPTPARPPPRRAGG